MLRSVRLKIFAHNITGADNMLHNILILLMAVGFLGGSKRAAETSGPDTIPRLKPGDVIFIKMWRHPEITDTFYVKADGTVEFPLIGPVKVEGMSASQLDDTLTKAYSRYYNNPQLDVIPLFKVAIIGEVNRPGVYLVKETDGLFEVIALAQGTTPKADLSRAKIQRGTKIITVNIGEALRESKTVKETGIKSGDIIIIPKKFWPSVADIYHVVATIGLMWSIYTAIKGGK